MLVNWDQYLALYQKARGGWFFGGEDWGGDAQLVLPQEGRYPLLVNIFDTRLNGRTMVKLAQDYTLYIRNKGLAGGGVSNMAGLLGRDMNFGYPEVLGGRIVTTNNQSFTKLVLSSLELRNSLIGRKKEYLRVYPAVLGEGWHTVEIGPANLEGSIKGNSPWVSEAMQESSTGFDTKEKSLAAYPYFEEQMDGFLTLLGAAADALTRWPMLAQ